MTEVNLTRWLEEAYPDLLPGVAFRVACDALGVDRCGKCLRRRLAEDPRLLANPSLASGASSSSRPSTSPPPSPPSPSPRPQVADPGPQKPAPMRGTPTNPHAPLHTPADPRLLHAERAGTSVRAIMHPYPGYASGTWTEFGQGRGRNRVKTGEEFEVGARVARELMAHWPFRVGRFGDNEGLEVVWPEPAPESAPELPDSSRPKKSKSSKEA